MATGPIKRNKERSFYINASTQLYNMHNEIPLNEPYFCVITYDVMQARAGINATGTGFCTKIDDDIVIFVLKAGTYVVEMQISNNAVATRRSVTLTSY